MSAFTKPELIEVWNDTKLYFRIGQRNIPASVKSTIQAEDLDVSGLSVFNEVIEVTGDDSYNLAMRYVAEGLNPLVLNMAGFRFYSRWWSGERINSTRGGTV